MKKPWLCLRKVQLCLLLIVKQAGSQEGSCEAHLSSERDYLKNLKSQTLVKTHYKHGT